jgi:hypothetical protein
VLPKSLRRRAQSRSISCLIKSSDDGINLPHEFALPDQDAIPADFVPAPKISGRWE